MIFNFLEAAVGVALIAIGGILIGDPLTKPAKLLLIPYAFFGAGAILVVIGLLDLIAAFKTNRRALKVGIGLLLFMLLALGGVVALIFMNQKKAADHVKGTYMSTMTLKERVKLHDKFKCCGMDDVKEAVAGNAVINTNDVTECKYNAPCYEPIKKDLAKKLKLALILGVAAVGVQLVAAIFTGCLLHKINKSEQKKRGKQKHVPLHEQYANDSKKKRKK